MQGPCVNPTQSTEPGDRAPIVNLVLVVKEQSADESEEHTQDEVH